MRHLGVVRILSRGHGGTLSPTSLRRPPDPCPSFTRARPPALVRASRAAAQGGQRVCPSSTMPVLRLFRRVVATMYTRGLPGCFRGAVGHQTPFTSHPGRDD